MLLSTTPMPMRAGTYRVGKWRRFLDKYPDQDAPAEEFEITRSLATEIGKVHRDILDRFEYRKETGDSWDLMDDDHDHGDCDDFALTERVWLNERLGIPLGALRMQVCRVPVAGKWFAHAILGLVTDRGYYVSDIQSVLAPLPWKVQRYRWLGRSYQGEEWQRPECYNQIAPA